MPEKDMGISQAQPPNLININPPRIRKHLQKSATKKQT